MMMMVVVLLVLLGVGVEGLGVNWGTQTSHPLGAEVVVRLLQDNGIKKVKLFDAEVHALKALAKTGIEVMVGIPNDQLQTIANSVKAASTWVESNVTEFYYDLGVNIKYVAVGNEPFLESYNGSFIPYSFPALRNIQNELNKAGLSKIKATIPLNADVYQGSLPSRGDFRPEIRGLMIKICQFLADNNAPFTVNIYPFISLTTDPNFPVEFVFFDNTGQTVMDGTTEYTNVFDANLDTLLWALKKAGFANLPIIVGEVGWPTDGDKNARANYAQRFNQGLLKHILSGQGTPLRAGIVETYLFGLIDEDNKSVAPGNFERHWGIFHYDGQPKYPLDLTGQGQDRALFPARGVTYLPKRWCILNPSANPALLSQLPNTITFACQRADCTPLSEGSSCADMDIKGNASYAFNRYYQTYNQADGTCVFSNMAYVVMSDPSQGECRYEVQIAAGISGRFNKIFWCMFLKVFMHFLFMIF